MSKKDPALGFNLLEQFTFYGSYHHNKWNKLIHIVFVPCILWSALALVAHSGPLVSFTIGDLVKPLGITLPAFFEANFVFNASFIAYAFYSVYYLTLGDMFAAVTYDVLLLLMFLSANAFNAAYGSQAFGYALAIQVLSWYMQIHPGHGILEGRKPALFDSLFQSVVLAPLFVWYEVLFVFGYKRQFQHELEASVLAAIAKFKADQKKA